MRVILAHNFNRITGGAEVFFHEVGRVLSQHGHQVAYFYPKDEIVEDDGNSQWNSYLPQAAEYKRGSHISRVAGFGNMVYSKAAKNCIQRLIADFKPDIVHAFAIYVRLTPSILDACREAHIPVVMSCNDYKLICSNCKLYHHGHLCDKCKGRRHYNAILGLCNRGSLTFSAAIALEAYIHKMMNIYLKNIHTFLFASEFMARKTEEHLGKGTFRWQLLRNPFESVAHTLHQEYDDYILYFGRLTEEKGVDILIRAMQHCPHVSLKVVGDGPFEQSLKNLAHGLNLLNVEFVGPRWGADLDRILYKARFVVVPSLWHENFPYVMLQSFSAGKAVIGSDRGGIPELLKDKEFGLVYSAEDVAALSCCINGLWGNPARTVAMGAQAKKWVDLEFNDNKFYNDLLSVYQGVLS